MNILKFSAFIVVACLLAVIVLMSVFTWQFGITFLAMIGLLFMVNYLGWWLGKETENS